MSALEIAREIVEMNAAQGAQATLYGPDIVGLAEAYLRAMNAQPQWIACAERMPEMGITVLVACHRGFGLTCRMGYIDEDAEPGAFTIYDNHGHTNGWWVTHWQPLPPAPVESP